MDWVVFGIATSIAVAFFGWGLWYQRRFLDDPLSAPPGATLPTTRRDAAQPAPSPVLPAIATPPRILSAWNVYQTLVQAVHVLLIGETGCGKSTTARAVLSGRVRAGHQLVVLDPHAQPQTWGGVAAIGAGRAYAAIADALQALRSEMTRRYAIYSQLPVGTPPPYAPLTICIDEWPAIQAHCPEASAVLTELAQEARKVQMHLLVLAQSDLVKSLGLDGRGDVREGFTFLLLGNKATAALADAPPLRRPAALRVGYQQDATPADVYGMIDAIGSIPASAVWQVSSVSPPPVDDDVAPSAACFLLPNDSGETAPRSEAPGSTPEKHPREAPDVPMPTSEQLALILQMLDTNASANAIIAALRDAGLGAQARTMYAWIATVKAAKTA